MDATLYTMQAVDPLGLAYGPLKIGWTTSIDRRKSEVRRWLPEGHDVQAFYTIPGVQLAASPHVHIARLPHNPTPAVA